jgi:hypothetical protein
VSEDWVTEWCEEMERLKPLAELLMAFPAEWEASRLPSGKVSTAAAAVRVLQRLSGMGAEPDGSHVVQRADPNACAIGGDHGGSVAIDGDHAVCRRCGMRWMSYAAWEAFNRGEWKP